MAEWKSIDDILDFAIGEEEKAQAFYEEMAGKSESSAMKEVFSGFALEEKGHRAKLIAVKEGKIEEPFAGKVADLKIGDYLVEMEATPETSYQEALIIAMKKEKAAFKMYSDMASSVKDENLENLFLGLAQEEAKHKLRFEVEYDDNILTEN